MYLFFGRNENFEAPHSPSVWAGLFFSRNEKFAHERASSETNNTLANTRTRKQSRSTSLGACTRPIISLIVPLTKMAATKHKCKSTHASAKSKKAKGGIASDAPLGVDREAVPWRDVWAAMKRSGWSWKGGSGIMTGYYYIKPKCRVQGGLSGRDYFVRIEDTMEFARNCYGWHNNAPSPTSRGELLSRIEDHARHCGERVPAPRHQRGEHNG
jgi:hypothetical protein